MDLLETAEIRRNNCRLKLEIIERAISEEMSLNYRKRRSMLLSFLYSEKTAYSLTLAELNTLFRDAGEQGRENTVPPVELKSLMNRGSAPGSDRDDFSADRRTYRVVPCGGIGDVFFLTPTLRALKQQNPKCRIH